MRLAIALAVGMAIPLCAGCSAHQPGHRIRVVTAPAPQGVQLTSALLFDARPGRYDPQEFAYRSDWPSTGAYQFTEESVYYSEWFVDYQGSTLGAPFGLGTYRQAESLRVGVGYR